MLDLSASRGRRAGARATHAGARLRSRLRRGGGPPAPGLRCPRTRSTPRAAGDAWAGREELGGRMQALFWLGPPLLAALVYAGALGNPFVYDDRVVVVANASLREPLANPLFVLLYSPYRPLVNASYALDHVVWGLDPFGYDLTGLLLHCANVVLLYALFARAPGSARGVAAFAAALFAVHPMGIESVGYVAGRAELLCATFFLASLLCFQGALVAAPGARRSVRIAAGLGAFALALASKETAAVLPAILALYDLVFLPREDPGRRRRFLRLHLPLLALVAAGAGLRLHGYLLAEDPSEIGFGSNLMTQLGVVWLYLRLLLVPVGLSVDRKS